MPEYSFDLHVDPPDDGEDLDLAAFGDWLRQLAQDLGEADVIEFALDSENPDVYTAIGEAIASPDEPSLCQKNVRILARIGRCPPKFDGGSLRLPKLVLGVETKLGG